MNATKSICTTHHHLATIRARIAVALLLGGSLVTATNPAHARSHDVTTATHDGLPGRSAAYLQTNLVSDLASMHAAFTDPKLVNPWGISYPPTGPFWISDNGTGFSTLYNSLGQPFPLPPTPPLAVTIPPPTGSPAGTTATPTGNIFNGTTDFVVSANGTSGPSRFIFASEDGTIAGWNPGVDPTHAILGVDNPNGSTGAVYKGLAMGNTGSGNVLYATNFHAGTIDVFDASFHPTTLLGSFADPGIPAGFAPFNIENIGGRLYVTYAKQDAAKHDDVAGPGNGYVDVFTTNGQLIRRLASGGTLNSPWGLTLAPPTQGKVRNELFVGNFGDGRINVFDPATGAFRGQLKDPQRNPLTISGLWGLTFGNGFTAGSTNTLFFSAGVDDEQHGLFGSLVKLSDDDSGDD